MNTYLSTKLTSALSLMLVSLAALSGCATSNGMTNSTEALGTATNVGMNVFKTAVDTKCRSEIEQQNMWRIASVAMSETQQESIKSKVCGCVSEQAPQQVSMIDIGQATIDANYRAQLVTKVVTKSLQTCYANAMNP